METPALLESLTRGARLEDLRLPGSSRQALNALAARRPSRTFAIFHGPGGTGKALVAEALAAHLRLPAYRIDLRRLVSTHIGVTEKHLDAVFDAAAAGGALLLFDEGDALMGPRAGVRDAHDRYAHADIDHLLRRIEASDGLAILTSNAVREVAPELVRRAAAIVGIPRTPAPAQPARGPRAHP